MLRMSFNSIKSMIEESLQKFIEDAKSQIDQTETITESDLIKELEEESVLQMLNEAKPLFDSNIKKCTDPEVFEKLHKQFSKLYEKLTILSKNSSTEFWTIIYINIRRLDACAALGHIYGKNASLNTETKEHERLVKQTHRKQAIKWYNTILAVVEEQKIIVEQHIGSDKDLENVKGSLKAMMLHANYQQARMLLLAASDSLLQSDFRQTLINLDIALKKFREVISKEFKEVAPYWYCADIHLKIFLAKISMLTDGDAGDYTDIWKSLRYFNKGFEMFNIHNLEPGIIKSFVSLGMTPELDNDEFVSSVKAFRNTAYLLLEKLYNFEKYQETIALCDALIKLESVISNSTISTLAYLYKGRSMFYKQPLDKEHALNIYNQGIIFAEKRTNELISRIDSSPKNEEKSISEATAQDKEELRKLIGAMMILHRDKNTAMEQSHKKDILKKPGIHVDPQTVVTYLLEGLIESIEKEKLKKEKLYEFEYAYSVLVRCIDEYFTEQAAKDDIVSKVNKAFGSYIMRNIKRDTVILVADIFIRFSKHNDNLGLAEAYLWKGKIYLHNNRYDEAYSTFTIGLREQKAKHDEFCLFKGHVERERGNFSLAIDNYKAAVVCASQNNSIKAAAEIWIEKTKKCAQDAVDEQKNHHSEGEDDISDIYEQETVPPLSKNIAKSKKAKRKKNFAKQQLDKPKIILKDAKQQIETETEKDKLSQLKLKLQIKIDVNLKTAKENLIKLTTSEPELKHLQDKAKEFTNYPFKTLHSQFLSESIKVVKKRIETIEIALVNLSLTTKSEETTQFLNESQKAADNTERHIQIVSEKMQKVQQELDDAIRLAQQQAEVEAELEKEKIRSEMHLKKQNAKKAQHLKNRKTKKAENKQNKTAQRIAEEQAAKAKAEAEQAAKAKAEAEQAAKAKAEAEQTAKAKAEAEQAAKAKIEAERVAKQKEVRQRLAEEKLAAELAAKRKIVADRQTEFLVSEIPLKILNELFEMDFNKLKNHKTSLNFYGSKMVKIGLAFYAIQESSLEKLDRIRKMPTRDLDTFVDSSMSAKVERIAHESKCETITQVLASVFEPKPRFDSDGRFCNFKKNMQGVEVEATVNYFDPITLSHNKPLRPLIPLLTLKGYYSSEPHANYPSIQFGESRYIIIEDSENTLYNAYNAGIYEYNLPDPKKNETCVFARGFGFSDKMLGDSTEEKPILNPGPNAQRMLNPGAEWAHYYFAIKLLASSNNSAQLISCYKDFQEVILKGYFGRAEFKDTLQAFCSTLLISKIQHQLSDDQKKIFAENKNQDGTAIAAFCHKNIELNIASNNMARILQAFFKPADVDRKLLLKIIEILLQSKDYSLARCLLEEEINLWVRRLKLKLELIKLPIEKIQWSLQETTPNLKYPYVTLFDFFADIIDQSTTEETIPIDKQLRPKVIKNLCEGLIKYYKVMPDNLAISMREMLKWIQSDPNMLKNENEFNLKILELNVFNFGTLELSYILIKDIIQKSLANNNDDDVYPFIAAQLENIIKIYYVMLKFEKNEIDMIARDLYFNCKTFTALDTNQLIHIIHNLVIYRLPSFEGYQLVYNCNSLSMQPNMSYDSCFSPGLVTNSIPNNESKRAVSASVSSGQTAKAPMHAATSSHAGKVPMHAATSSHAAKVPIHPATASHPGKVPMQPAKSGHLAKASTLATSDSAVDSNISQSSSRRSMRWKRVSYCENPAVVWKTRPTKAAARSSTGASSTTVVDKDSSSKPKQSLSVRK